MNLSHPVASTSNRLPWLLAVVVLLSLSILLGSIPDKPLFVSAEAPAMNRPAIPASHQSYTPQVIPVPGPSHARLTPMQAPTVSATPIPAETKPFPIARPVATPPAEK